MDTFTSTALNSLIYNRNVADELQGRSAPTITVNDRADITYKTSKISDEVSGENSVDKIRLVSAGFRILKTSISDTESGSLEVIHSRAGMEMSSDIDSTFDKYISTDDYKKVYIAGHKKKGLL